MAMDDAIQYLYTLNFSFQFHIGTSTFARTCKKSCADGAKTIMETQESDIKHQLVMPNEASKNNHDGRCKSFYLCRTLILAPHSHIVFCIFGQSQWGTTMTCTHTNKSIVIVFQRRRRLTFSFAFRHQFLCLIIIFTSTCPHCLLSFFEMPI